MPSGVIIKGIGGFYYVKTEDGVYECKARGIFRKDSIIPLPGDRVSISVIDGIRKIGNVEKILPRDIQLIRPAVANITQVAVVISVKAPLPDYGLLDKLLLSATKEGLGCFICLNKTDLCSEDEYKQIVESYAKSGYSIVLLSTVLDMGFDCLEKALKGEVTVFAGQSGVGKSTVLNRVLNAYVMQTGEVSERIERGKHTTRHAELIELKSGGFVVDTPGFSSFDLSGIEPEKLQFYYPEFDTFIGKCKFSGCNHVSEPGCEVRFALEDGELDLGRYLRYVELFNNLKQQYKKKYN